MESLVERRQCLLKGILQVIVHRVRFRLRGNLTRLLTVEATQGTNRLQSNSRVIVVDLTAQQREYIRNAVAPKTEYTSRRGADSRVRRT